MWAKRTDGERLLRNLSWNPVAVSARKGSVLRISSVRQSLYCVPLHVWTGRMDTQRRKTPAFTQPVPVDRESVTACTPDMSAVIAFAPAFDDRCRMITLRAAILASVCGGESYGIYR